MEEEKGVTTARPMTGSVSRIPERQAGAPSFLSLPPEIRNLIYKALFVRARSVMLVPNFIPTAVHGIQFLATSRQISTEATAFLYAQNTFIVYNSDHGGFEKCSNVAAAWLTQLGTSSHLVVKIILMIGRVDSHDDMVDVLPLLRHMWSRSVPDLEIQFATAKPPRPSSGNSVQQVVDSQRKLGSLLRLAGSRAHVHWRMYSRLRDYLQQVTLSPHSTSISFALRSSSLSQYESEPLIHQYQIDENRNIDYTMRVRRVSALDECMTFPRFGQLLMDLLAPPEDSVTYDLSLCKSSTAPPHIAAVNQMYRSFALDSWSKTHFEVSMTSDQVHASFDGYQHLDQWLSNRRSIPEDPLNANALTLHLKFAPRDDCKSEDLRFDGLGLLWTLLDEFIPLEPRIRVHIRHTAVASSIEDTGTSFDILQATVSMLCEDVLKSFVYKEEILGATLSMWFDRRGTPREGELTVGGTLVRVVHNERAEWDHDKIFQTYPITRDRLMGIVNNGKDQCFAGHGEKPRSLLDWILVLNDARWG